MVQLTSAILLLSAATSAFATQCFYPAGNPAPGNVPCDDNAAVSPCCSTKDRCLSNGLCRVNSDPETTEYARGACTDDSWGSGCFPQCLISHPGSPITNGAAVFMCNSTGYTDPRGASYCCEKSIDQKTGCCSGSTFWLPPGAVAVPIVSSSSSAPVQSSSAPATVSVTTIDSYTTTTVPCTTSTTPISVPAVQNSTTTAASSTSSAVVTDVGSTTIAVPTNGTTTVVQPSPPVPTGAASKYSVAGAGALIGVFAFALL